MREILFRGKRLNSEEWVEGLFCYGPFSDAPCIQIADHAYKKVDPDTVGQYTGLTDKNGKRIFEGAILRNEENVVYSGSYTAEVIFEDGEFKALGNVVDFDACDFPYVRVIGNIHDTPELLEAEE